MGNTTILPAGTHQCVVAGYNDDAPSVIAEGSKSECEAERAAYIAAHGLRGTDARAVSVRAVRLTATQRAQIDRSAARAALLASFARP